MIDVVNIRKVLLAIPDLAWTYYSHRSCVLRRKLKLIHF